MSSYASQISSPSNLSIESSVVSDKTVLNGSNGSAGGGSVSSSNASNLVTKKTDVIEELNTANVVSIGLDELSSDSKVLVLEDDLLVTSSPANLKSVSLKSVSSNSSIYGSLTSSTAINFFDHYVSNLNPFVHYVAFRESQYDYTLVYGDIEYNNGSFEGNGKYVRFNNYSYNDYTLSVGSVSNFGLNPASYIVYSDFEGFPCFGGGVTEKIKILSLVVPFIFVIIWIIFRCVPYRFGFKSKKS